MGWAELNQQAHTGAVSLARPNGLIPTSSQGRAGELLEESAPNTALILLRNS